jgi:hypothetical protein
MESPGANEILYWSFAAAAIAYAGALIGQAHAPNPLAPGVLTASLFNAGAINLAAWVMIALRIRALPRRRAPWSLIVLALLLALLCAAPVELAPAAALAALGIVLLKERRNAAGAFQIGVIALALAASLAWPSLRFIHLVAAPVDARFVQCLLHLRGIDVGVEGNVITDGNFSIEVLAACASSAPLACVALAYVVTSIHLRERLQKSDLRWLLLSLLISAALTELRLSLMVPSEAAWNWWHNGPGLTIYELSSLLPAILCPAAAGRRGRPAHPAHQPRAAA